MQDIKNKIEAVLFMTGRLMKVDEIAEYCGIKSVGVVKEAMKALHLDYKNKEGGLEVYEEDNSYKLNIKKEYNHLSTKLVSGCLYAIKANVACDGASNSEPETNFVDK